MGVRVLTGTLNFNKMVINTDIQCYWVDGNINSIPKSFPVYCKVKRGKNIHNFEITNADMYFRMCQKTAEPFVWLFDEHKFEEMEVA